MLLNVIYKDSINNASYSFDRKQKNRSFDFDSFFI